jgi:hypothetical protein
LKSCAKETEDPRKDEREETQEEMKKRQGKKRKDLGKDLVGCDGCVWENISKPQLWPGAAVLYAHDLTSLRR